MFARAFEEAQPRNRLEVDELIDQVNVARNSMMRKHGFAPYQHVFGSDLRVPGLINEADQQVAYSTGMVHGEDAFRRKHEMRQAARRAMVHIDEDLKVRLSLDHRSRPPTGHIPLGKWCITGDEIPRKISLDHGKDLQRSLDSTMNLESGLAMETRCLDVHLNTFVQ